MGLLGHEHSGHCGEARYSADREQACRTAPRADLGVTAGPWQPAWWLGGTSASLQARDLGQVAEISQPQGAHL